jgi:hypothetical protein
MGKPALVYAVNADRGAVKAVVEALPVLRGVTTDAGVGALLV